MGHYQPLSWLTFAIDWLIQRKQTSMLSARAVPFDKAKDGAATVRVADRFIIDSIRPLQIHYGDKLRFYGVRIQDLFAVDQGFGNLIPDIFSYTGNLEGLKGKLQELQENKKLMLKELEERKKAWKNAVQNLIDEVAPIYQQVLSTVGATGAIRLDEGVAVGEAGLQLLVGFKGAEPAILDPYTQSGGERSVALVAFMLSLQSRIISPLRAMDEFDIHMDPRNREAIFKMILAQGKRNPNSQHIVITPSIITVADRTAHVITVRGTGYRLDPPG